MRRNLYVLSLFVLLLLLTATAARAQQHPLDPLTKDEIASVTRILKDSGRATAESRFSIIALHEPPKSEVATFQSGSNFRREAFVVVYERAANRTSEAVVDLRANKVQSWKVIPGVQPSFMIEDVLLTGSIVRKDPQWQAAMRKRGITDFNKVQIDPWPAGYFGFPDEEGKRLIRGVSALRGEGRNPYARPIEGVIAVVDLNQKRLLKLIDTGVVPVPEATAELDEKSVGPLREALKPLEIMQSKGPDFEIRGHEVRWQKWRFRYSLHPREGLVLHTVGYEDEGRLRSILYRASLSEMVVPYGDPGAGWFFRNAFDSGEAGIGKLALPLEAKNDVPENAVLRDAVFANEAGGAYDARRVVALYERDGGVLWKHVDYMTNHNESRRARQLVISYFANVGNYEYGFNWVFHQDGTLEMEALLTGIMAVKGVAPDAELDHNGPLAAHGHRVAPGVEAVHHQHFFNFRLDFDIDGEGNSVVEQNASALPPGPKNPYRNTFTMTERVLARELSAQRMIDLATARRWRVVNPSKRNNLGAPTGYLLFPGENSVPFAAPGSSVRRRAAFMNAHLWVTPYAPEEMNAAGYYINQSKGGEGLPRWTRANREIANRDVVVWYSMGVTHIPRPEDWPVMPVHKAGFKLLPYGFFSRNPALDVPKQ